MRARYYDAVTARFLSRDPIWPEIHDPGQINPYQYAIENSLSHIDPIGTKLPPVGSFSGEGGTEVIAQLLGVDIPSKSWLGLLIALVKGSPTGYKGLDPEWPNGAPQFVKEHIWEQFVSGQLKDPRPWERQYINEIAQQRYTEELERLRKEREELDALMKKVLAEEKERKFWEAFAKIKPRPVSPPEVVGQRRTVEKHYQSIVVSENPGLGELLALRLRMLESDPPSRSFEEILEELKEERIAELKRRIEQLHILIWGSGHDQFHREEEQFKDELWKLVDEVRKLTGRNLGLYEIIPMR